MLSQLESDTSNLNLLAEIQNRIRSKIIYTERRIVHHRGYAKKLRGFLRSQRVLRHQAQQLKDEIKTQEYKVKDYRRMLYFWRCFGDGVVFLYLDKWAVKPLMFNWSDASEKLGPGHISGKAGLRFELKALRYIISQNVPAILSDLTNCIRHGDICVLVGPDPMLFEVKSGKKSSQRELRQLKNIESLHRYYERDEEFNVMGVDRVCRKEPDLPEKNYLNKFDKAVGDALRTGFSVKNLEPEIRLIVFRDAPNSDDNRFFNGIKEPAICDLNTTKRMLQWGYYYPFTLFLKTAENLYAFLHGDVYIIVVFDLLKIKNYANSLGMNFSLIGEGDRNIRIAMKDKLTNEEAVLKLSCYFTERIAHELISWRWVLNFQNQRLLEMMRKEK